MGLFLCPRDPDLLGPTHRNTRRPSGENHSFNIFR